MPEARTGPIRNKTDVRSVANVIQQLDQQIKEGLAQELVPVPTEFTPMDNVLGGGLRPGDLTLIGGSPGVGKTIMSLQIARNMALQGKTALYFCYEHEEAALLGRLLALELGALPHSQDDVEMEKLRLGIQEVASGASGRGLLDVLEGEEMAQMAFQHVEAYADNLFLVKASSAHAGLGEIEDAVDRHQRKGEDVVLFVDYLQKVSVRPEPPDEAEKVTRIVETLKDMALRRKIPVIAIVAADKEGLKSRRLRLHHLRGSSALAYECDIALILNDKFNCVSKVHLSYDPVRAETFKDYTVVTIEKNRGGPNLIDLEFRKHFLYYRFDSVGDIVRERLVDERIQEE
ncbi:MAG TPA: DnaB-like helicase C-terminal domain-containing protein [Actinomycetota bacterium]